MNLPSDPLVLKSTTYFYNDLGHGLSVAADMFPSIIQFLYQKGLGENVNSIYHIDSDVVEVLYS